MTNTQNARPDQNMNVSKAVTCRTLSCKSFALNCDDSVIAFAAITAGAVFIIQAVVSALMPAQ